MSFDFGYAVKIMILIGLTRAIPESVEMLFYFTIALIPPTEPRHGDGNVNLRTMELGSRLWSCKLPRMPTIMNAPGFGWKLSLHRRSLPLKTYSPCGLASLGWLAACFQSGGP